MTITPYYQDDHATIYHGDCLEIMPGLDFDVIVTDPPYGISYATAWNRKRDRARSIANDETTDVRDVVLDAVGRYTPCLVFGSSKQPKPTRTKITLTWEKTGSSGMGDLSMPWRPNTEEVYVMGDGWSRTNGRESSVVRWNALTGDQDHPNEKPGGLMRHLIDRCPPGVILDPFMGSGTTLRAAKDLGRHSIGIELEEKYCEIAATRLGQEVLDLGI